jgi:hypothetical protein
LALGSTEEPLTLPSGRGNDDEDDAAVVVVAAKP